MVKSKGQVQGLTGILWVIFIHKIIRIINYLKRNDGTLQDQVIRSGFWVGSSNVINWILNFIRSIILARILFPEIYGLMAICLIVIDGMAVFTQTGLEAAIIHRQDNIEEAKNTIFTINVARGVILFLIGFLLAPVIATYYDNSDLIVLLRVLSVVFIIRGAYNTNLIILRKELNFKKITYFDTINIMVSFVILITLVYYLRNIWALIISTIIASLIHTILSFIIIPGMPQFKINYKILKQLYSYGKFVSGVIIVTFILTQCDNAFVGKVLGMKALGFYVLAFGLANLPVTSMTELTSKVMFSAYNKIQTDIPLLRQAYLKLLKFLALLAIPSAMGIAVLAPEIVRIIYGEKWMPAVGVLRVLCCFAMIRALSSTASPILTAVGYPKIIFRISVGRLIFMAALIYPLTMKYGIIGTGYAVLIPIIAEIIIGLLYVIKRINIKITDIMAAVAYPIICAIIMILLLLYIKIYFPATDISRLIAMVFLGVIIYFTLILLIDHRNIMTIFPRRHDT